MHLRISDFILVDYIPIPCIGPIPLGHLAICIWYRRRLQLGGVAKWIMIIEYFKCICT